MPRIDGDAEHPVSRLEDGKRFQQTPSVRTAAREKVCGQQRQHSQGTVTSLRAVEEKGALTMAAELEFSPPEIPEPTFMENVLRYGLFFGAIFQLICVLAIILPVPKSHKTMRKAVFRTDIPSSAQESFDAVGTGEGLGQFEPKNSETVKKPKATAPQISKKPKKETKKKR
ncbi:hypothetical protein DUI87_27750 [Hirundo rustica rustica]|uniref:Protein MANBAL n=1 Tax=Hirundo rustica rustica TaxID=333673 RepID=A0A3M0J3Y5_HIRRU|nr:hypothetical protein DUI87_27750 [Hirundo rustica rustica]